MKVFLAGIMQGSLRGNGLHDQGYRDMIGTAVRQNLPGAEIIDPWALNPDSPSYEDERARQTFFHFCDQAGQVDLLIAFLPEASMGTAIEMWQAYRHGVPVITVSPMDNWVVRFLSWRVCRSLGELEAVLQQESLPLHWPEKRGAPPSRDGTAL